jgi:hypothetical protein
VRVDFKKNSLAHSVANDEGMQNGIPEWAESEHQHRGDYRT